jgi:S-adenosylmethionine:tRNA ribosyltransferase-isomerase
MRTSDFDYELPPELIAQEPPAERGASRMLVLDRAADTLDHRQVSDLPALLRPGDLLVLNDTRVFPARVVGRWADTGGRVELLLVEPLAAEQADGARQVSVWQVLCGAGRPVRPGLAAVFADGGLRAEFGARQPDGSVTATLSADRPLFDLLDTHGLTPVPPYIHREADDARQAVDRARYQTVYARATGAVAAPTAGLHLTADLLAVLARQGVPHVFVTLHVGPGTFRPVKAEQVEDHRMDAERYEVPVATAEAIAACRNRGGRVVAVGSTTVRTLETVAAEHGRVVAAGGRSALFIRPPYEFRVVDAMLTNFHLPKSTLLMMVAALAGRERVLAAYRAAVAARYRFFSYGDCMLIR